MEGAAVDVRDDWRQRLAGLRVGTHKGERRVHKPLMTLMPRHLSGGEATETWLGRFHGRPLLLPRDAEERPSASFVAWHEKQVFRAPAKAS